MLFAIVKNYMSENDVTLNGTDLSERPIMEKYLNFIRNDCKLTNAYYAIKEDNSEKENYKLRSFNSYELKKIRHA